MNSTNRTKEFINDQDLQMQSLHLRTRLQVRHQTQCLQMRTVVQVRPELRLHRLTFARRSARSVSKATITLVT
jgi:hypothetical protein